jgi:hypothetical protein
VSGVILRGKFAGCRAGDLFRSDLVLIGKDPRCPLADQLTIREELQRRRDLAGRLWRQRVAPHRPNQ